MTRLEAIKKRLADYHRDISEAGYAYDPDEISSIREFKQHASEDIEALIAVVEVAVRFVVDETTSPEGEAMTDANLVDLQRTVATVLEVEEGT